MYAFPVFAIASIAILLSTLTKNSAAAVVTTLMLSLIMQLLGIISALNFLDPYLLPTQFNAWQGLLRDPPDWAPVVRAAWDAFAETAAAAPESLRKGPRGGGRDTSKVVSHVEESDHGPDALRRAQLEPVAGA